MWSINSFRPSISNLQPYNVSNALCNFTPVSVGGIYNGREWHFTGVYCATRYGFTVQIVLHSRQLVPLPPSIFAVAMFCSSTTWGVTLTTGMAWSKVTSRDPDQFRNLKPVPNWYSCFTKYAGSWASVTSRPSSPPNTVLSHSRKRKKTTITSHLMPSCMIGRLQLYGADSSCCISSLWIMCTDYHKA